MEKENKNKQSDNEKGNIPNVKNDEQLKQDLELLFSYARSHSASINPLNEQEMIHIINLKVEVFKRLKL